uniref:Ferredoxin n=1 Tax=Ignisphaera aggregans TaxID=334771 RepID=A0A7C2VCX1_9CREN
MVLEEETIKEAVIHVAKLMVLAAKTAPKAKGVDNIVTRILSSREELEALAKKMEELAQVYNEDRWRRDADNVRRSIAVVIIGCKLVDMGVETPSFWSLDASKVLSIVNLGIALGSAAKIASLLNVDNRIMFTVGVAVQELKLVDADFAIGIPLSATAKNIYFDRAWPPKRQ